MNVDAVLYLGASDGWSPLCPYRSLAAGTRRAFRKDPPIATRFHEHCLILTIAGEGAIEVAGRQFAARAGDLAWIDTSTRYSHACAPGAEQWDYLWLGMEGYQIGDLHQRLDVSAQPIFPLGEDTAATNIFAEIIGRLKQPSAAGNLEISGLIAGLLAQLVQSRAGRLSVQPIGGEGGLPALIAAIRANIDQPWPIARMARAMALSPSQLHRLFKARYATSPAEWLRHERLVLAKRQLNANHEQIAVLARRCGYDDPFHFSRDFRKLTGMSPTQYRKSSRF
jgi:AraC family transcriptional regulator, arabinose operon regulatory protein